ncbi:MAG: hypothetical protein K2J47_10365 [Ruminococcus sp.]|nr:hypothetical protein [Ruminococcus sp.]
MIYENKILKKADATNTLLSFNDICKMFGLEIIESNTPSIDDTVKCNAKEIIQHFNQCSDILLFIQSAISRSCYDLKYSLHPPYTTSNLDCEYILKKLVNTNLIEDFYYSSLSKSYRIDINSISDYDINNILCIGLCSLLNEVAATDIIFNSCFKLRDGEFIYADVACQFNNRILLFNFEIASGLEKDVASHSEQLKKLSDRIFQSYTVESKNIHKYFVVTTHCKTLLPSHKRIISVNDLLEWVNNLKI